METFNYRNICLYSHTNSIHIKVFQTIFLKCINVCTLNIIRMYLKTLSDDLVKVIAITNWVHEWFIECRLFENAILNTLLGR